MAMINLVLEIGLHSIIMEHICKKLACENKKKTLEMAKLVTSEKYFYLVLYHSEAALLHLLICK